MKAALAALFAFSAFAVSSMLAQAEPAASEIAQPTKPRVQKGMSADEVRGIIGRPREIKPIETEGVKGESWIYRRVAKRLVHQVAPTTEKVPMWGGPGANVANGDIVDVSVPFLRNERVTIYQMTALLFIDGKVVASKQWFERESLFD